MNTKQEPNHLQVATLGGGCFWCLDPLFAELSGVKKVEVGYAGGDAAHPSYQAVCTGATGHAEVVQVNFDPTQISYKELLEVFFTMHDPTAQSPGYDIHKCRSIVISRRRAETSPSRSSGIRAGRYMGWSHRNPGRAVREFLPAEDMPGLFQPKSDKATA
jgi:peptide-methionine (S)-S-oxide reductase